MNTSILDVPEILIDAPLQSRGPGVIPNGGCCNGAPGGVL